MCGIFGSTDLERFKTLYKINQGRGDFSYGGIYISEDPIIQNSFTLTKCEGTADLETNTFKNAKYYLGHTQAPTSSVREFDPETTHPFKSGNWFTAHNGVLSNAEQLKKKYSLRTTNDVDTSVIPALVRYYKIDTGNPDADERRCLKLGLQDLQGTFSCWFFNIETGNMYLARCGSTLFGNIEAGEFSSSRYGEENLEQLPEGRLYKIGKKLAEVEQFQYNSPYFIL